MPGEQMLIPVSSTIAVSEGDARNIFLFLSTRFNMHLFIITACMWWGRAAWHSAHAEVRGHRRAVGLLLLPVWVPGIDLRLSGSCGRCLIH